MREHLTNPALSSRERLWFATVLASLLLLILMIGCVGQQFPGDVPTMSDPSVARLVKSTNNKVVGYCTVFKVGHDMAMTAGHCCGDDEDADPKDITTFHADGPHAIPGAAFEVLVDDDEHDVCVLKGMLRGAPLQIALHDPAPGARVWTAGFPKRVFLITSGHWAGRDEEGRGVASVGVWGGASGSPVLDKESRILGVLVAFYPPMSNMAIITPIEWVRAALLRAKALSK